MIILRIISSSMMTSEAARSISLIDAFESERVGLKVMVFPAAGAPSSCPHCHFAKQLDAG